MADFSAPLPQAAGGSGGELKSAGAALRALITREFWASAYASLQSERVARLKALAKSCINPLEFSKPATSAEAMARVVANARAFLPVYVGAVVLPLMIFTLLSSWWLFLGGIAIWSARALSSRRDRQRATFRNACGGRGGRRTATERPLPPTRGGRTAPRRIAPRRAAGLVVRVRGQEGGGDARPLRRTDPQADRLRRRLAARDACHGHDLRLRLGRRPSLPGRQTRDLPRERPQSPATQPVTRHSGRPTLARSRPTATARGCRLGRGRTQCSG